MFGTFHHVGYGYLPTYLREFEHRFNRRKMGDAERFAALMSPTQGRVTRFARLLSLRILMRRFVLD